MSEPQLKKRKISYKSKWISFTGAEIKVIPQCDGDKFLFARDLKKGWEYCAMTWQAVYDQVMQGWQTKKYCNIFQHRNGNNENALSKYNGLENFAKNIKCVLYFDIDDEVPKEEDHNRDEYLQGFQKAVSDVLGIAEPMRVQESCGIKSNGVYKVSYHILFPSVHFSGLGQLKQFLNEKASKREGKMYLNNFVYDPAVYHKGYWRLPYCVKKGQNRVMIPSDVQEMTLQAFKELSIHFIPSDSRLIEVEVKSNPTRLETGKRPKHTACVPTPITSNVWNNISDAHVHEIRKQVEIQLTEVVDCSEPEIVKECSEQYGPSLKLSYRAKSSCSRTCLFGVVHTTGNRFVVFVNMITGSILYHCHGEDKQIYLAPLKAAFRIRSEFNDHTQINKFDEDYLWWRLKNLAREQEPIQHEIDSRNKNLHAARRNYMKQAVPLINKCYAMLCDKKTSIIQRTVSHSIGVKPVVDYISRDIRTIKEQLGTNKVQVKEWKMVPVKGSQTGAMYRIDYNVTFSPIDYWLDSENILKYNKRVFNARPYGMNECANAVQLNLFTGIDHPSTCQMTPEEMKAAEEGPLKPVLCHIRNIWCGNDHIVFAWVIMFLAITVAKPWIKIKVALILKSLPRTGKGIIFVLLEKMLGSKYVSMPTSIDDVTVKQFNSQYTAHCLLMILDEAFWGGSKKIKGAIKKLITEGYANVDEKFEVGYRTEACWNTIFASNEKHVVNMDIASGKMLVLDVSNKYAGVSSDPAAKKIYMDKVRATDVQLLSDYFHSMDFTKWNPYDLPTTNASKEQMQRSLSREHKFIFKVLNDPTVLMQNSEDKKTKDIRIKSEKIFDGLSLDRSALYHHYVTSCGRGEVSPKMFWNEWKQCIPKTVTIKKTIRNRIGKVCRGIELPELDIARASFCKAMYMQLEFDEIDCSDIKNDRGHYIH